jgi:hypothetical protein
MEHLNMQDRNVSLTTVCAAVLWALALVLIFLELFTRIETGDLGVVASVGAGVLFVRGFFAELAEREQNAFELGRDSVDPSR